MNNNNLLHKSGTKLRVNVDGSELYDFELVEISLGKVDCVLDYSEYYDFELFEIVTGKIDVVLDYSEFYDYALGENFFDFESFISIIDEHVIITNNNDFLVTNDNYLIEYIN